jgi:general stress protein 26
MFQLIWKEEKLNISSICNLFCKTHTSLQIDALKKIIFECIWKSGLSIYFNKVKNDPRIKYLIK